MSKSIESKKNALDFVHSSMYSLSFLESITNLIFSKDRDKLSVGQFYDEWIKGIGVEERKIPFNLGAILGYIYCGILYTKENAYSILPNIDFKTVGENWGITTSVYEIPKNTNPKFKYVISRVRNSLAHGNFDINVPENIGREEVFEKITITFYDVNAKDPQDTFKIELKLRELAKFVQEFTRRIYEELKDK